MDSTERINEINGKMALFMGYRFIKKKPWYKFGAYSVDVFKKDDMWMFAYGYDQLRYHYDWNWLMGVVAKIEELGYHVMINRWTSVYNGDTEGERTVVSALESDNKLVNTWYAVGKFIEWYNENQEV